MRVVSTTCSNTEIVCALGCAHYLVGVDDHSDFPTEVVASLARVGPDLTVDIDKIAALQPDLVLASLTVPGHEKVIAALQQAGLPYLAPEPVSLADVYADIQLIAERLAVTERATTVISQMQETITKTHTEDSPSILVQWWPKPVIAPGKQSWVNDLLMAAGLSNPLANRDVKSTPLDDAEVAAINPDAIVISWCGVRPEKYRPEVVYNNPAFAGLKAIKNKQVYCIPEGYLGRPSPRLIEGYKAFSQLAEALRLV